SSRSLLSDHAAHWANYLEMLIKELPMHYSSWRQVPMKRKAGVLENIEMSADVARGHGGDGGGDDRPPSHQVPTGCGGFLGNLVEPELQTIVEMADNRTMAQMLEAPIEGYEDAIVVPPINTNNFELK
nr:hypothetical protein [Tanacetum cinerariifolium]